MRKLTFGRKLALAIVLTIIASTFVCFDKFTGDSWMSFMIWIYGTYATTNVGEHFAKRGQYET